MSNFDPNLRKLCELAQRKKRLEEGELESKVRALQGFEKKERFLRAYDPAAQRDINFVGPDEKPVYAHRFIMAGKSTVFQRMFHCDMEEKSGTVVVNDASSAVLKSLVNFCYTAETEFTEDASAEEMLKISHKYEIGYLNEVCEEELCKGVNRNNLCRLLKLAHLYDAKKLDSATAQFFRENFTDVYKNVVEILCRVPTLE